VVDKRKVRRDLADRVCTLEEGVKGRRALDWRLVDELAPRSRFDEVVRERALETARTSDRPADAAGIVQLTEDALTYEYLRVELDRERGLARLVVRGPKAVPPAGIDEMIEEIVREPAAYWPLATVRELDDALLHLRFNEPRLGLLVLASEGDLDLVARHDAALLERRDHWLFREILLYWKRTLKRLDVSARTLFALVEPGSCFAGLLAELVFAADRIYMFSGERAGSDRPPPALRLSEASFGLLPMPNGLGRLQTRFLGEPERLLAAREAIGRDLDAPAAENAGLVTVVLDEVDWDDEVRVAIEERASFSADALSGLEANLRFAGPETLETKIFGRLSAWQNWIFGRPNATGEAGALKRYGTGLRPDFDTERV
jgi:benzoyl-CoA-dihydrodiol lyase